ncbi:hypothetical protein [Mesorhizobium sp.]|uniref:hypothetical protein n=1 Tax=Mesorhizobium sp. TaxID=1871066 RepID=UPI0012269C1E|nr:hypothetical protein [Mesorhizobium sp.]TIL46133.1 MAG: hypothetical protein E5Y86_08510 [Mesorhizobium sp.]
MRKWLVVMPMLALAGCDDGKEVAIAQCRLDEVRIYGPDKPSEGDMWEQSNYVSTCMRSKGYRPVPHDIKSDCNNNLWRRTSAVCYRSAGFFSNLFNR